MTYMYYNIKTTTLISGFFISSFKNLKNDIKKLKFY